MGNRRAVEAIEPRALLQGASNGSQEGYCDTGPGGCVGIGDATLQEAIHREVMTSTGLRLFKIVDKLSVKHWSRSSHSEQREWIEFPYVINISESGKDIPPADSGRASSLTNQMEGVVWATEAEIRAGKYMLHEGHKNIILEAFEKERTANKRLPWVGRMVRVEPPAMWM